MAKKNLESGTAKSVPKKETVKKAPIKPKVKSVKMKSQIELVSYSIKAVIPTQQFGNIQPEIVVKAPTIEEARNFIEPIMEEIYQKYAEATPDGRTPKFFKKPEVQVVEKVVTSPGTTGAPIVPGQIKPFETKIESNPVMPLTPQTTGTGPQTGWAPSPTKPSWQKEENNDVPFKDTEPPEALNSAGYLKGASMIENSMTLDALNVVEQKVKDSVKLSPQEKSSLLELVLKKRNTFK